MKCPQCSFENPEGMKFCGECGARLDKPCPACGYSNPPQFKFCGECGQSLEKPKESAQIDYSAPQSYTPKHLAEKILTSKSALEGERKLVTVLFADVANFTAMSEKLDPEDVHRIMDGCFRILMDEVHRYEGTINQFTGDGVMALFGAPVALEDHAGRACHAALSIRKSMGEYGERVVKEYGVGFKMRMGLNSGMVVVGAIGDDLRMDYTAEGDATNLASRMESLAEPGTILITKNTHRFVQDYFKFRSLGKVEVKGKAEPQEVFELIKTGSAASRIEAAAAKGLTKFVGRENSMAALIEAYEKVKNGSGQVVGVVGEAGVGKSRLLLEFRNSLPREEPTYLEGRCIHFGGAMPYLPALDILRSFFGIEEGEHETTIRRRVTEKIVQFGENLAGILPPLQDLLSLKVQDEGYLQLEPKQRKERIFEGLRNLLIRTSQNKHLIVAIEDLHWIDKTTEEFLDYFIGWMANVKVMLVLLYRPEYTHQWGNRSYFNRIGLDQLSLQSSAELVRAILDGGEAAPELSDLIMNRAAGNPFFMEELTHTLLESGSIRKEKDLYVLAGSPSELQVPDTVQGIIAARIDRLEETLKRIMQVASVIGREFAFRILQTIVDMREELKTHLLNLQGLEFIYEKSLFPELEYIFKHALTQEVAYNSLLSSRKKELHGKIGSAIEEIYTDRLEEFYEMLAYHYSNSHDLERAVHFLKLSGDKAKRTYSLREAFHFYGDAYNILKQMHETDENKKERIEVILAMGHPMEFLAYPENSFELLQRGEELCKDLEDKRSWAHIHSILGMYYSGIGGNAPLGLKYQQEAFETAEDLQDGATIIRVGANLCFAYDYAGEYRKIVQAAPKVIAFLEERQEKFEFFETPVDLHPVLLSLYGHALGYTGKFDRGEQACEKALSLAQDGGNPYSLAWVEFMYGCMFIPKGDGEKAVKHLQNSIGYFEKLRVLSGLLVAWGLLAQGYTLLEESGKALEYAQKMLKVKTGIKSAGFISLGYLPLSSAYLNSGKLNEAKVHAEQALNLAQEHHEKYCEGMAWVQLGRIMGKMEASNVDEAEECILRGMTILEDLETKPSHAVGCFSLCELYLNSGRMEKGVEALRRSEEMFTRMKMDHWAGKAQGVLASLKQAGVGV